MKMIPMNDFPDKFHASDFPYRAFCLFCGNSFIYFKCSTCNKLVINQSWSFRDNGNATCSACFLISIKQGEYKNLT